MKPINEFMDTIYICKRKFPDKPNAVLVSLLVLSEDVQAYVNFSSDAGSNGSPRLIVFYIKFPGLANMHILLLVMPCVTCKQEITHSYW
jgi:hypothetical protein